jgi:hypothetical protein
MLRRINLSAAIIVLVCFFLPWEQVSCAGAKDTLSGLDLARHDHASLWFVPVLMGAVIVLGLVRAWKAKPQSYSIVSAVCGGVAAYLMNSERLRVHDESDLISAQLTGWFWLALISSLAVAISALASLLRKQRGP